LGTVIEDVIAGVIIAPFFSHISLLV
jgi:hypothetical protein